MLKNVSRLELKIADKIYHLTCDADSPIEHVKEALFQFQKFVGRIEDEAKAKASEAEANSSSETKADEVEG